MAESEHRPRPTLEDLLRLKRAERPSPEFWANFESELRQKQLAALVRQDPWWRAWPRRLMVRAAYLPVGATAVLALTFALLRHTPPVVSTGSEAAAMRIVGGGEAARNQPQTAGAIETVAPETGRVRFDDRISVAMTTLANPPGAGITALVPWNAADRVTASDSPSARFIAANLERLEQTDPGLFHGLLNGGRPVVLARTQRTSSHAIDLANVAVNMARHSRLIPVEATTRPYTREPMAPQLVRERLARRLAEKDLTDQLGRLAVKGDRLSLRL
jgi:hypothetical protein